MGVGGWNPRVITEATGAAGQGLEKLGAGVEDLDDAQTNQNNQLQQAQARAQVLSQTTGALAKLPSLTDPGQISDLKDSINNTVSTAASQFKDPRQGQLFTADITPHVAETFGRFDGRAREITNNNLIAGYETNTNATINNAAAIDDDTASAAPLQSINAHVQTLQDTGVITPEQAVTYRKQASQDYVEARYAYLEQWAITHNDPSRLQSFISSQQPLFSPADGAAPAGGPVNQNIPPEGRALLATIYGPESGGAYDKRYTPTGGATFSGFDDHPRIRETIPAGQPNAGMTSDAAGAGQMLSSTWDFEKKKLGLTDFSPANQDAAAWDLAKTTYAQKTGRDLETDLQSRDPRVIAGVAPALKGQWSSLPGGVQPGTTVDKFTNDFFGNLTKQTQSGPAFRGLPSAQGQVAGPGAPATPPAAAPAPTADNAFFVGDSIADGLRSAVPGAPGDTKASRSPADVLTAINGIDPAALKGRTVYLSPGASNSPTDIAVTADQISALKAKGVDPANIRIVGVGDRPDFVAGKVNDKLAAIASQTGATFTGPLDPSNLRRNPQDNSDNGVHLADWKKGLGQAAGSPASPARAATPSFLPTDPPPSAWPPGTAYVAHSAAGDPIYVGHDGTPLPAQLQPSVQSAQAADSLSAAAPASAPSPIAPPQSKWPAGTARVAVNPDGTMSYVGNDGTSSPVPGSKATGAPGAWLPNRPSGSLLDALPAQEHAQLLMRAQMALDRIARQSDMQQQQDSKTAMVQLDGISKAMATGMTIDDATWDGYRKSYNQSPDPNVRLAFAETDAIRNQLSSFRGVAPEAVSARVDAARADYAKAFAADPASGDTYIKGEVLGASQAYLTKYQTDIKNNSLGRAAQDNVITGVTPLTSAASVQTRVAQAQRVQDFYHLDTPQYLTPQERLDMKKTAAAGGQPMVDLATEIVAGGGADAPAMFKEIGGSAPGLQAIGRLALDQNGDHSDTISSIAGYAHALTDPDAKKDLPRFSEGFMKHNKIEDPLGEAYAGFGPDAEAQLRQTANMILGARANAAGVDPKLDAGKAPLTDSSFYGKAYDDALGANYDKDGVKYGGVAPVGGHYSWNGWGGAAGKTLAPSDIRADKLDWVMDNIKDSDLAAMQKPPYSGGTPLTMKDIHEGQVVALPDKNGLFAGSYAIRMPDPNGGPPRDVTDQDGKRFILNLNDPKLNGALRARVPDAFMTGAPRTGPTAPPAKPYRNLPGMLEATASNDTGPTIPQGD